MNSEKIKQAFPGEHFPEDGSYYAKMDMWQRIYEGEPEWKAVKQAVSAIRCFLYYLREIFSELLTYVQNSGLIVITRDPMRGVRGGAGQSQLRPGEGTGLRIISANLSGG